MLPQPIFDDRALNESFYRALIRCFYEPLNSATQGILSECNLGFAPSPSGDLTFLIVAPSLLIAEQLVEEVDTLLNRVLELMAGVGQIAICVNSAVKERHPKRPPQYMMCKLFPVMDD